MRIFSVSLLLKSAGYGNCGGRKLPRGIVVRTAQVQALTRESWSTTLLPYLGTKVPSKVVRKYESTFESTVLVLLYHGYDSCCQPREYHAYLYNTCTFVGASYDRHYRINTFYSQIFYLGYLRYTHTIQRRYLLDELASQKSSSRNKRNEEQQKLPYGTSTAVHVHVHVQRCCTAVRKKTQEWVHVQCTCTRVQRTAVHTSATFA